MRKDTFSNGAAQLLLIQDIDTLYLHKSQDLVFRPQLTVECTHVGHKLILLELHWNIGVRILCAVK